MKLLTFVILLIGIQEEMTRKCFFFKFKHSANHGRTSIYERCLFFSINQETIKSIDKYVTVSRSMTDNCEVNQFKESLIRELLMGSRTVKLKKDS